MIGSLIWIWRSSAGYRLTPWKSPYLRWRLETYWGIHADEISFSVFWQFVWAHRDELMRFLRWAGKMDAAAH